MSSTWQGNSPSKGDPETKFAALVPFTDQGDETPCRLNPNSPSIGGSRVDLSDSVQLLTARSTT